MTEICRFLVFPYCSCSRHIGIVINYDVAKTTVQYCFHISCAENEGEFCFTNSQLVRFAHSLVVRKTELTFIFCTLDMKTVLK